VQCVGLLLLWRAGAAARKRAHERVGVGGRARAGALYYLYLSLKAYGLRRPSPAHAFPLCSSARRDY
jgi:hypothetical protein